MEVEDFRKKVDELRQREIENRKVIYELQNKNETMSIDNGIKNKEILKSKSEISELKLMIDGLKAKIEDYNQKQN